jgi:hypothetical protein
MTERIPGVPFEFLPTEQKDLKIVQGEMNRILERIYEALQSLKSNTDSDLDAAGDDGEAERNNSSVTFYVGELIGMDTSGIWAKALADSIRPMLLVTALCPPGAIIEWVVAGPAVVRMQGALDPAIGDLLFLSTTEDGTVTNVRPSGSGIEVWLIGLAASANDNPDATRDAIINMGMVPDVGF